MHKNHKDPDTINLEAPRFAQCMHKAWKNIKIRCIGSTSTLLWRKNWSSIKHDRTHAIILHEIFPAYCIPKVVRMETGEVKSEKQTASFRPPPKTSLKHDWKKVLDSENGQRFNNSSTVPNQTNQFQTQIMIERGNTFLEPSQTWRQVEEKRPVLGRSKHVSSKDFFTDSRSQPSQRNDNPSHDSTGIPLRQNSGNRYTFLSWLQKYQFVFWSAKKRQIYKQKRWCGW